MPTPGALLTQPGLLLVAAVLAAALVRAIVPWSSRPHATPLRLVQWLAVTAIVAAALDYVQDFARLLAYGSQMITTARDFDFSSQPERDGLVWVALGVNVLAAVAWLAGYVVAGLLMRRVRWAEIAARTGWCLDGWRRWAVFLLAGPLFGWLLRWVPSAVIPAYMVGMTASYGEPAPGLIGNFVDAQAVVASGVIGALVAWAWLRDRRAHGPAWIDGARAARCLAWIGVVGFLGFGLRSAGGTIAPLANMSVPMQYGGMKGIDSLGEGAAKWPYWLALAITLVPLLAVRRPEWREIESLTGRAWSLAPRVLGALTLGAWLSWPVAFASAVARGDLGRFGVPASTTWVSMAAAVVVAAAILRTGRGERPETDAP